MCELLAAGERAFSELRSTRGAPSSNAPFARFDLGAVAAAALLPVLSAALSRSAWPSPLEDPSAGGIASAVAKWRTLIEAGAAGDDFGARHQHGHYRHHHGHHHHHQNDPSFCPYASLLEATVLPRLCAALASEQLWDPVEDARRQRGVALLEAWEAAAPAGMLAAAVAEGAALPRLERALRGWEWESGADGKASLPLPHQWLHPWLPWLPTRLPDLWPGVRQKLSRALERRWKQEEEDGGEAAGSAAAALALLRPWRAVFASSSAASEKQPASPSSVVLAAPSNGATPVTSQWDRLLSRAVLPRLRSLLLPPASGGKGLTIDPSNQDLKPWHSAMALATPLLSRSSLADLLCVSFFPQWQAVLRAWLRSPDADFGEVAAWYEAWRALLPESVAEDARVRAQLEGGLAAMEAALGGEPLPAAPGAAAAAAISPAAAAAAAEEKRKREEEAQAAAAATAPLSLRALVEAFAADADLSFAPAPQGRRHAGLPVYLLGGVPVVLDSARSALLAKLGRGGDGEEASAEWRPASLEDVASAARSRGGPR
jgi:tuftelin-interacting protein 11